MNKRTLVYILGDVHGDIARLNNFINKYVREHPAVKMLAQDEAKGGDEFRVIILQTGDMAFFWPHVNHAGMINNRIDFLHDKYVPIYWCGGNHEDWDQLDKLFPDGSIEAQSNIAQVDRSIYFCRFGAALKLTPDITALFAGGAESCDKQYRLHKMQMAGFPKIWWEQEGISREDLARLQDIPRAEWIVSHTAPSAFNLYPFLSRDYDSGIGHIDEPSRDLLQKVLEKYHPKKWFFGHFHMYMSGQTDGCHWQGLADLASREQSWASKMLIYES